ncbi:MAG: 30S ribosomal protein S16 [Parcubacteria group bacterium]|nr:30S ribosomal protein S16 [Parcubacteria group bacterium]
MLAIKLKRIGKKKQASYRVVVAEKRSKAGGKYVEDLGWNNPHSDKFNVNAERAKYWLQNGAQPTDSVFNLLVKAGAVSGPKKPKGKAKKEAEAAVK